MPDEEDICTCVITYDDASNAALIDPTGCTYSGHFDPPADLFAELEEKP